METKVECTGRSYPDKGNNIAIIGSNIVDNNPSDWDKCYIKMESDMKKIDSTKDLTSMKKSLQEKGYIKMGNVIFAIGHIMP
jgi:hypothetical protein